MHLKIRIALILQICIGFPISWAVCPDPTPLHPDNPPQKLSATGLFDDLDTLRPCKQLVKYELNQAFWSDGASKTRWILLPGKIEFMPEDPWKYPRGTILVKHFELKDKNRQQIRIETRLLMSLGDDDWYGYTYQWQDDQKDAILLKESSTKEYLVFDPIEGERKQTWTFPSKQACLQCHNSWSGYALGPRTEQLNLIAHGESNNQLDQWNENNFFSSKLEKASQYKKYIKVSDQSQTLEQRVKSYLAVNCAQCHQPESPVRTQIDFRFKTSIQDMKIIGQKPNSGDMGIPDGVLVRPGKKEESILWQRLVSTTTMRMPPIGSTELDREAVALVGTWIDSLPTTSPSLNVSLPK